MAVGNSFGGVSLPGLEIKVKKLEVQVDRMSKFNSFILQALRNQDSIIQLHDSAIEALKHTLVTKSVVTNEEFEDFMKTAQTNVKARAEQAIAKIQQEAKEKAEAKALEESKVSQEISPSQEG